MKKYLLTALLGVFGLFGFASATDYTFVGSNGDYTPNSFELTEDYTFSINDFPNYFCDENLNDECIITFSTESIYDGNTCGFGFTTSDDNFHQLSWAGNCTFSEGDILYVGRDDGGNFSSITVSVGSSSGGGDSGGSLLPGGEGDLSGIISGLNSVIDEFLPYLVYIGLGLITATIGFIAIRWLVNRTSAKVRGTFSSGKRRR